MDLNSGHHACKCFSNSFMLYMSIYSVNCFAVLRVFKFRMSVCAPNLSKTAVDHNNYYTKVFLALCLSGSYSAL